MLYAIIFAQKFAAEILAAQNKSLLKNDVILEQPIIPFLELQVVWKNPILDPGMLFYIHKLLGPDCLQTIYDGHV